MEIIKMTADHWPEVRTIYEQGIASGHATFQTSAPGWEEWDRSHLEACRLIMIDNSVVLGWCALTPVSSRSVYAGVAEVSVYVSPDAQGKGIGNRLLQALVKISEQHGIWTLQASIFPENKGSLKIHHHAGFRIVGVRERIGKMNGVWRDTILLEKRSASVGTQ